MRNSYRLGILKLIDVAQNALIHALTIQEMYEKNLEPAQYDEVHAKHKRLVRERFQAQEFQRAVGSLQRDHPKSLSAA